MAKTKRLSVLESGRVLYLPAARIRPNPLQPRKHFDAGALQELAEKKYFMNASYLSRLFKAKCGKTFSKYLIEYRLEKSRELLEKTILKVSDIAAHVGYNDVSHYIQSFRKVYGVTPEQYRNSLEKPEK